MIQTKQTRVELFGSKDDPEVKRSINKIAITGRKTELSPAPNFETGQGNCGKLCHCPKGHCAMAYKGDQGATMGMSF